MYLLEMSLRFNQRSVICFRICEATIILIICRQSHSGVFRSLSNVYDEMFCAFSFQISVCFRQNLCKLPHVVKL